MQAFKASSDAISGLCFTPDGLGLATSSAARMALWDITGAPKAVREFGDGGIVGTVAVSPCGRFLSHGCNRLRVVDLTDEGKEPVLAVLGGHLPAFAPDGTEFAVPGFTPGQWAMPSWKVIRAKPPRRDPPAGSPFCTGAIAYTPDSRLIGVSFAVMNSHGTRYDSCVRLFDRATGEVTAEVRMPFGHAHPTQIAFSPDGAEIAGNFGPVLGVVSVADGKQVARVKVGTKHITALAFTPDGSKCVTVSNDTRVRVYDAQSWTETSGYEWKIGPLRCVAVAPDGLRMAAGSARGKVIIWDVDG